MRSPRSGSNKRQRHNDVRIRLSGEEIEKFDLAVKDAGLRGQQARGDWVRAQLGLLPIPDPAALVSHQRVPVPGGQALLARLGGAGTELRKLAIFVGAYVTDRLPLEDRARLEKDLLPWTGELLEKLDAIIEEVAARFAEEGGAR